jgi:hypothetical protein
MPGDAIIPEENCISGAEGRSYCSGQHLEEAAAATDHRRHSVWRGEEENKERKVEGTALLLLLEA